MYRLVVYMNSFVVKGRRYYAAGRFYIYERQVTLLSQIMYKVPTQVHWFPLVYLGRTNTIEPAVQNCSFARPAVLEPTCCKLVIWPLARVSWLTW